MTSSNKYSRLFKEKISGLKNIERKGFKCSHIVLFQEYQKRLFTWKHTLKAIPVDLFNKDKSFHNLFLDLSPTWNDELIPESRVINDLKLLDLPGIHLTHRDYYGFFICMYLNWEIFKDSPEIKAFSDLPHPYEPILEMFYRGAYIFNSEKKFEIDDKRYLKIDVSLNTPKISDAFLNFLDSKCISYPNYEKINQLWIEYNLPNIDQMNLTVG